MGVRILQYRTVEAAWQASWLPWLRRHADILDSGTPALVVVDHAQQIGWLKHRALGEGLSLCGVEWMTAAGLRRWLAQTLGVAFDPFGRENLELILRLEGPEDGALARGARDALAALDELGRAGWLETPEPARDHLLARGAEALVRSGGWTPALEQSMRETLREHPRLEIPVLVTGWGSGHAGDGRLLFLTSKITDKLTVTVPTPRFLGGDDADARWVSWLEVGLETESEICPEPESESPHQRFVDSLVTETEDGPVPLPAIQIGYDPPDQIRKVIDWLADFPFDEAGGGEVACIVPGEGESLTLLGDALARAGIPAHQEVGETASSGSFQIFHQMLTRLLKSRGDVEVALDLLEWLTARGEPAFKSLKVGELRALAVDQFRTLQHRSLPRWKHALDPPDSAEASILTDLAEWLAAWEGQQSWEEWRDRYRAVAVRFGFTTDYLEPVWSRMNPLLDGRSLSAALFLDYIASLLEVPGQWRPEKLGQPVARLRLTTPEMAGGRTWAGWIWMDAHDGAWPAEIRENAFLPDARKREWNRSLNPGCAPLLTGSDRSALKRRLVLDLLENTSGPVCFSGSLTMGSAPELKTYPNEWVAQVLLRSGLDEKEALSRWTAMRPRNPDSPASMVAGLPPAEKVAEVAGIRRNPETIPGEYEFIFGPEGELEKPPSVSASGAEWLLHHPAQWALENRMEAVPREVSDFCRSDGLLLGIWTHDTLARILKACLGGAPAEPDPWPASALGEGDSASDLRLDLLRKKSEWMARSCLQQLSGSFGDAAVEEVEFSPQRQIIDTPSGPLEIRGRVDLLLREATGRLCIIDFKTGSTGGIPTVYKLEKDGEGLQYVVYLELLAAEEGAVTRVVQPLGGSDRELNLEQAQSARPHWDQMGRMFYRGEFPLRSTARSAYGGGGVSLPISTLPIADAVLQAKWDLLNRERPS